MRRSECLIRCPARRRRGLLTLGQVECDQRIGMAMTQSMLGFEQSDKLHVLEVAGRLQDAEPMLDGVSVLLLDGRKVRRWTLNLGVGCHGGDLVRCGRAGEILPTPGCRGTGPRRRCAGNVTQRSRRQGGRSAAARVAAVGGAGVFAGRAVDVEGCSQHHDIDRVVGR